MRVVSKLSDELRAEIEHLKATDPDEYEHVYDGMCRQAVAGAVYMADSPLFVRGERLVLIAYDASKPVDTFWDLGYSDNVSIWLVQSVSEKCADSIQALRHYRARSRCTIGRHMRRMRSGRRRTAAEERAGEAEVAIQVIAMELNDRRGRAK